MKGTDRVRTDRVIYEVEPVVKAQFERGTDRVCRRTDKFIFDKITSPASLLEIS